MPSMDTSSTRDSSTSSSPSGRPPASSSSMTCGAAGKVSVGGVMYDRVAHHPRSSTQGGQTEGVTRSLLPVGVTSPAVLGERLRETGYLADAGLAAASYLAIAMGRP